MDIIGLIANFSAILTALIAVFFYYQTLKKNYYLNNIPGNYKIFSTLKDNKNATVLYQIKISYVSTNGWFFGYLKYSEIYSHPNSRSSGTACVFGKVDYSFLRIINNTILRLIRRKKYNPLNANYTSSFRGKLYLLSRNDLDLSKLNWEESITQEYSIIHYRDSERLKLFAPIKADSYLQIPEELVLINVDKVPDQMLNYEIEF